jgi:hypothetical protein
MARVQNLSPELLSVNQDVMRGRHPVYPLRTVLGWFGDDKGKARRLLRAAMQALNLRSRPDASSASISSTVVFFSALPGALKPAITDKHSLPDITDIEKKLRLESRTREKAPAPPPQRRDVAATRSAATPKPAAPVASWMQMVQEVRQTMICSVCDQEIPTRKRDRDMRAVALFGAADFAVCCCCLQTVPKRLEKPAYCTRWIEYRHRMRVSGPAG